MAWHLVKTNLAYMPTKLKLDSEFTLFCDPSFRNPLISPLKALETLTFADLNLKHGDLLFAKIESSDSKPTISQQLNKNTLPSTQSSTVSQSSRNIYKQSLLDFDLEKEKGLIIRNRDPEFCKHNNNAMCEYCMPLEAYDSNYLLQNKIKHMSFHSYLRKSINNAQKKVGLANGPLPKHPLPLEQLNFQAKKNCNGGHAPWPEGICTKCQPSAITLQQQEFRMSDHLELAEAGIIERFLSWWRETGTQRFGLMYGKFEKYTKVPLGIKAVVEAIYEPQQTNMVDGLIVDIESPEFISEVSNVNSLAKSFDLELVGIIFTDLTDDGSGLSKVEYKRHKDSYFLTGLEYRLAAKLQHLYPNPSRWSQDGYFGSRLVTAVISGNENSDVDIFAWQISNTGVELERSNLTLASSDPGLMMVKKHTIKSKSQHSSKSSSESEPLKQSNADSLALQYVPDILYKYTNEYNASVIKSAKPYFPVEYLLVSLTHGFPQTPKPMFKAKNSYYIENRHSSQTAASLSNHLLQCNVLSEHPVLSDVIKNYFSDFHLIVYISSLGILTIGHQESFSSNQCSNATTSISELENKSDLELLALIAMSPEKNQSAESEVDAENCLKILSTRPTWLSFITILKNSLDNDQTGFSKFITPTVNTTGQSIQTNALNNPRYGNAEEMNMSDLTGERNNQMEVDDLGTWSCRHCTFDNNSTTEWCAICGLPRND
ncbi:hypothetical protein BB561_005186 [Smittium simulii]|uniref:Nuclear protein localization protein 4 n=1 Tax=Smittium simulii TaxID=133385 RepID=A0A2T9YBM1_9FUNG|nr:hypothetical protein BB561_005186 [Smittium simulii]